MNFNIVDGRPADLRKDSRGSSGFTGAQTKITNAFSSNNQAVVSMNQEWSFLNGDQISLGQTIAIKKVEIFTID